MKIHRNIAQGKDRRKMSKEERKFWIDFGIIVKSHRRRIKVSQQTLAEGLEVSRAHIPNIEAGRSRVSAYGALTIAYILNFPVKRLFSPYE